MELIGPTAVNKHEMRLDVKVNINVTYLVVERIFPIGFQAM